jgi:hypothetical protein
MQKSVVGQDIEHRAAPSPSQNVEDDRARRVISVSTQVGAEGVACSKFPYLSVAKHPAVDAQATASNLSNSPFDSHVGLASLALDEDAENPSPAPTQIELDGHDTPKNVEPFVGPARGGHLLESPNSDDVATDATDAAAPPPPVDLLPNATQSVPDLQFTPRKTASGTVTAVQVASEPGGVPAPGFCETRS